MNEQRTTCSMLKTYELTIPFCCLTFGALRADQPTVVMSPDGPIATLNDARLRVRELKEKHPGQSIEVLIKGGAYPLRETVVFGVEDSSAIGSFQRGNGMKRCRDRSEVGLERYLGYAVLGRNIHLCLSCPGRLLHASTIVRP